MQIPDGYTDIPDSKLVTVVTSLEMRTPPAPRSPMQTAPWVLERVHRPDVQWYRDLYRQIGEQWLWWSRLVMHDTALEEILHAPEVEVFALLSDGEALGLLELDFRGGEDCELAFFGVTDALIGSGAGRWLMDRAIEAAFEKLIRRFWVHTCTLDHPRALDFYMSSGFIPYHRQVEVADDPRLTGILPRDAAPHFPCIGTSTGQTP